MLHHFLMTPMHIDFPLDQIYNSLDDFEELEKCVGNGNKEGVMNEDDSENKENIPEEPEKVSHKIVIEEVDEELLTPLSKINLKWRRKSAGFSNSDSVASVSAISHSNQSQMKVLLQSSTKLVRTTSTPMTQLLSKPGNLDSLCGSSYQASSIEPSSSGSETDQSASMTSNNCSPSPAIVMKRNQFPVQRAKQMRYRLSKAQTPLRQVMSKSIQRAIMEQQNEKTKLTANVRMPRKMIFDSMSSSDGSMDEPLGLAASKIPNVSGVLDLRTTPVIKRTMSAPISRHYKHKEYEETPPFRRPKSEESLIVEALIEEHYKRSDLREKINAISDNVINETKYEPGVIPLPPTPETENTQLNDNTNGSIGIFKSCMEDETPYKAPLVKKSAIVTPMQSTIPIQESSFMKEIWYTPKNISTSMELFQSPESFRVSEEDNGVDDEVFTPASEVRSDQSQNPIWRLFSTVMKIASGSLSETPKIQEPAPKPSLVKRSLGHLGILRPMKRPSYTKSSPTPHLKRKRNTSSQSSLNNGETSTVPELRSPVAKKYKSITGRKPIQRMRSK